MSIFTDLLFLHGHIHDPRSFADPSAGPSTTAAASRRPAADESVPAPAAEPEPDAAAPSRTATVLSPQGGPLQFFRGLLHLDALEPVAARIGFEEPAYGPTYGNRIASIRAFGRRAKPAGLAGAGESAPSLCMAGGCG